MDYVNRATSFEKSRGLELGTKRRIQSSHKRNTDPVQITLVAPVESDTKTTSSQECRLGFRSLDSISRLGILGFILGR